MLNNSHPGIFQMSLTNRFSFAGSTFRDFSISIVCLVGLFSLSLAPISGNAAQLPAFPRIFIDTSYDPPAGNTISVNAGEDFRAALNDAQPGDTIVLQAGATFTGPFRLPNKTAGSGWIYIRSSAYSSLPPPGSRVSPSDAANMPKIDVGESDGSQAIIAAPGAHNYRFVGIEIKPKADNFIYNLVVIDNGTSDIVFDRCYVHGDPAQGGRRGFDLDAARGAVIDSYVSDFKESNADSQAIWVYNSPGPIKIVNNYLEAAGENVLFGGADPTVANLVPSDVEIRRNHFFKPLSWQGTQWDVKNLLEFKNARRVLVEGNLFENNWADAQSGLAVLFGPRNENGTAPWSTGEDLTFRLNRIRNVAGAFNIGGEDDNYPSENTNRVLLQDNIIELSQTLEGDRRIFQLAGIKGPNNVTIVHNTGLTEKGYAGLLEIYGKGDQLDIRDNIMGGEYEFSGTGTDAGTDALDTYYTNWQFSKNAMIEGVADKYPSGNYFPANVGAVGFVDYAGGNYRLAASSPYKNAGSDGRDLGADIDAIVEASTGDRRSTSLPAPKNLQIQ